MSVFNCSTCGLTLQYEAAESAADFEQYLERWVSRHCLQCVKPARENRWTLPAPAECGPALSRLLDVRPMTDAEAEAVLSSRDALQLRLQRLKGHYREDPVFVAAAKLVLHGEDEWMATLARRDPEAATRAGRWADRFRDLP